MSVEKELKNNCHKLKKKMDYLKTDYSLSTYSGIVRGGGGGGGLGSGSAKQSECIQCCVLAPKGTRKYVLWLAPSFTSFRGLPIPKSSSFLYPF